jgi:DNA-binding CsgD family transcriptional regulator
VAALRHQHDGGWSPAVIDTLELLARAELARGRADRGAVLAGAADAARRQRGLVRGWPASPELAELEQHARAGMLGSQPAEGWAAGGRLTLSQAAEYATRGRGPRRRALHGIDSLTPSEQAVATLAAAGLTTPAIAEQLVVSRNTVKTHLSRVYAKLGVSGRTALAAKIAHMGDVPPPPHP